MAKNKRKSRGRREDFLNEHEVENKTDKEMEVADNEAKRNKSPEKRRDSKGSTERHEQSGSGPHSHAYKTPIRDAPVKVGARHRDRKSENHEEKISQKGDHENSYDATERRELNKSLIKSEPFRRPEGRDNYDKRRSFVREHTKRRPQDGSLDLNKMEFRKYDDEFQRTHGKIDYETVNEIEEDLFKISSEYSLAHCVAEDMNMGSGIAVTFRYKFQKVDELLNQRQKPGGLAVLKDKDRYIYYLVTKKFSTGKPTYKTLFSSLQEMKKHIQENNVTKLAMPRIGCGLDRLEWDRVKFMIEYIFKGVDVFIVICNLVVENSSQSRHRNCKQVNVHYPIETIEEGTLIVYLSSEDGHISEEMEKLDEKFHCLTEFRHHKKSLGDTIISTKIPKYWVVGCIVRKSIYDPIDFVVLRSCMTKIQKDNKKFGFIGFQAMKDDRDDCVNYKIINIMRNTLRDVDVYICWQGDLQQEMSVTDGFSDSFSASNYQSRDSISRKDQSCSRDSDNNWRSSSKKDESFRTNHFELSKTYSDKEEADGDHGSNEPSTSEQTCAVDWLEKSEPRRSKHFENLQTPKRKSDDLNDQSQTENPIIVESDYEKYKQEPTSSSYFNKVKIMDNKPNLPENYSKICYVSEDFCLQSAIPSGFNITTHLGNLLNQNHREGSCVFLKEANLYCLIVKKLWNSMYKQEIIFNSLQNLKKWVLQNQVRKLVIPEMKGSKKESFDFGAIPNMLEYLFQDYTIEIIIAPFSFEPYPESVLKKNKIVLTHSKSSLFQAKKKTMIIYWASEDGDISNDMEKLKGTFNFLQQFVEEPKKIGNVIKFKQNEDHVLYGCIVKRTQNDLIDFEALERCISIVSDTNTEQLNSAVASAVETDDESINYKIINILINNLQNVNISLCWPKSMREKMPTKN